MWEKFKKLFEGNWSEEKQRTWAWGFIIGFFMTNAGYGIGFLLVKLLDHLGGK